VLALTLAVYAITVVESDELTLTTAPSVPESETELLDTEMV
jgi:hypothetical protein